MAKFKIGDKVRRANGNDFSNGSKVVTVGEWKGSFRQGPNHVWLVETASYLEDSKLELAEANPFIKTVTTTTLNRGYVMKTLPSGEDFTISGGSRTAVLMSNKGSIHVKNCDIPEIIKHLQNFYDATQSEKVDD